MTKKIRSVPVDPHDPPITTDKKTDNLLKYTRILIYRPGALQHLLRQNHRNKGNLLLKTKNMQSLPRLAMTIAAMLMPQAARALDPIGCLIKPDDTIALSTPVAGIVESVLAHRGDTVRAGQIIARLDTQVDTISLALAEARAKDQSAIEARRARVAYLEEQADRLTELASRNAISTAQRDEAISEANVAGFELAQAEAQAAIAALEADRERALLAQKTLRSPVDGIITEQLLSPGEYRDGQAHIATIAQLGMLRVEAYAPLDYFGQFAVGDTVQITPEDPVGGTYPATITVIDQVFDAATATFGIEMMIDNSAGTLPAGLRCMAAFGS